ncbi:hypothetical protein AJ80_09375 [Polytolypa hystricis UAMH7299]|uniref:LIM zinc-binding domain-containing protein n=1 Tax=Polytolypa hystricis (strain UAMH7299) TaxID=1447883 RepID=A0A2B7WS32_POLH7|nr:hypothetical protein AJ80_09375 [Polytolypa hystricis UAMH7299]
MDPLSITVSISSLLVACAQVVKVASDIRGKYKTASLTISSIATECVTVTTALSHLQMLAIRRAEFFDSNTINMFDCVITGCKLTLSVLDEYIMEISAGGTDTYGPGRMTTKSKAKVIWNEAEMRELLQQLRGHESSLNLLLTVMQSQSGVETQDLLRQNQAALDKILARARTSRRKKAPNSLEKSQLAFTDTDSILSDADSILSATSFEFDNIIVNSRVYREVMRNKVQRAAERQIGLLPIGFDGLPDPSMEGNGQPSITPAESVPNQDDTSDKERGIPRIRHKFSFESDSTVKITTHGNEPTNTPHVLITTAPPLSTPDEPPSSNPIVILDEEPGITRPISSIALTKHETEASSARGSSDSEIDSGPNPDDKETSRELDHAHTAPVSEDDPGLSARQQTQPTRQVGSGRPFCSACEKKISGKIARALGRTFHLECFTCADCGENTTSKFFPAEPQDGESNQGVLCETDFYRRLDLLCTRCGRALRGSYATALDKKYHLEHFTCTTCHDGLNLLDSYYGHDGDIYCQYHYSTELASRCLGCHIPILKRFAQIERNGQQQSWHLDCYMIHEYWNVTLAGSDMLIYPPFELSKIQARRNESNSLSTINK